MLSARQAMLGLLVLGCGTMHGIDGGPDSAVDAAEDGGVVRDAGPSDADVEDGGIDITALFLDFCTREGEILCSGRTSCCSVPGRATCSLESIRERCSRLAEDPALQDGSLLWQADNAEDYLAELDTTAAACSARNRSWPHGLDRVLLGTLEAGEDCTPFRPSLSSLGMHACRDGLRCELSGTGDDFVGVCASPGALGDTCNLDCGPGLFCQSDSDADTPYWGRCETQDDAAECLSDYACSTVFCDLRTCIEPDPADTWCSILG